MEQFKKKFIEEASEHLTRLEQELLSIEESNQTDNVEDIFRPLHTLKGASSMFGFNNIEEITHQLESIYDEIRSEKRSLDKSLIDLTFHTIDHIRKLLEDEDFTDEANINNHTILLEKINRITQSEEKDEVEYIEEKISSQLQYTAQIIIKPEIHPDDRGMDMNIVFDDLKGLGECIVIEKKLKDSAEQMPFWEIYIATNKPKSDIEEVLIFLEGEYDYTQLFEANLLNYDWFFERIKNYDINAPFNLIDLKETIASNYSEEPTKEKEVETKEEKKKTKQSQSIKVSADKLDRLMNLVSELVTTKAELELVVSIKDEDRLEEITEKIDKLAKQFRDNALDIRLVPISTIMLDFKRLIRDMSGELGKLVVFDQIGTDTELDKNIIESLKNPLMHIIRNSLDHGLEPPEERVLWNKPKEGTITFKAYQSGNNAIIEISDDGRGINIDQIKKKAVSKGIITNETILEEKEIYDLIFLPGFSTAQKVTEVSGRGVGMDVVMKMINNLSGSIDIESKAGEGTTFTIKLPLTLSIIDTLMVKSNNIPFLIPLSQVETCTNFKENKLTTKAQEMVLVDNEPIPTIHLKKLFKMYLNKEEKEKVIIIRNGTLLTGIIVDDVVGEHQAVLRPLGEIFKNQKFLSGGSILGDGSVALVLDTTKLMNESSKKY